MDHRDLDRYALDHDVALPEGAGQLPWSPPTVEELDCLDTAVNWAMPGGVDGGMYS